MLSRMRKRKAEEIEKLGYSAESMFNFIGYKKTTDNKFEIVLDRGMEKICFDKKYETVCKTELGTDVGEFDKYELQAVRQMFYERGWD